MLLLFFNNIILGRYVWSILVQNSFYANTRYTVIRCSVFRTHCYRILCKFHAIKKLLVRATSTAFFGKSFSPGYAKLTRLTPSKHARTIYLYINYYYLLRYVVVIVNKRPMFDYIQRTDSIVFVK